MDFAEILDATQPVDIEYMGRTFIANVYTAGPSRLTLSQLHRLEELNGALQELQNRTNVLKEQLEKPDISEGRSSELQEELKALAKEVDQSRMAQESLPMTISGFEIVTAPAANGTPRVSEELILRGEKINEKNIGELPGAFLFIAAIKVRDVWGSPTNGAESGSSAPPMEKQESDQPENIVLSANSA